MTAGPLHIWLMAARPRTLPAAIAPVLVGTAAAMHEVERLGGERFGDLRIDVLIAALAGSVLIQIGTNLANDYSDAKRGTDSADRLGPVRVTATGLATPRRVLHATWTAFAMALAVGVYLTIEVGPEMLAIGAVSILAGVLYTGGPRPYGYEGLGEIFVFLFFGLVAVNGSYYVQLEQIDGLAVLLSVGVGLISAAILIVNNIRDIETDRRAGKNTLAVRLGRERTRVLYAATLAAAYLLLPLALLFDDAGWAIAGVLTAPLAIAPLRAVRRRTDGPALNDALAGTGVLLFAYSLVISIALVLA